MKSFAHIHRITASHGAILLLALVYMLMLAIIVTLVLQAAVLQLRMAGNDQFLEEAFHQAQAIVTELSLNPDNFTLEGGVGHTNCPAESRDVECDGRELQAPASAVTTPGVELDYRITRQEPLLWKGFSLRDSEDRASSSNNFNAAIYEIDARIDGSAKHLGSAHMVQGIAVRVGALR